MLNGGPVISRSVHRPRRLWTGAQYAGRDLEPVVERNPLVEQERRSSQVVLRGFRAPALLLPTDERRACLFHDVSLADRREPVVFAISDMLFLVSAYVPRRRIEAMVVNLSLTRLAGPRPFRCRRPADPTREFRLGVARRVTGCYGAIGRRPQALPRADALFQLAVSILLSRGIVGSLWVAVIELGRADPISVSRTTSGACAPARLAHHG